MDSHLSDAVPTKYMNALSEIKSRFKRVLDQMVDDSSSLLEMIRPAQDSKFGDYQANCAMPMKGMLGEPPRKIAEQIVAKLEIDDLCHSVEIAGPGFINLKLDDSWLKQRLTEALPDPRLGVPLVDTPGTYVIDFSSPNVAKPMHVGHIRSTLIGDGLSKTLRFVGHRVITDNHLGDWGTQFGMIIYGYKHLVNPQAYAEKPVQELGRLYKQVRQIIDFHAASQQRPTLLERIAKQRAELEELDSGEPVDDKKKRKEIGRRKAKIAEQQEQANELEAKMATVQSDTDLLKLAEQHTDIATEVLTETAKLHAGDQENLALWNEFLPYCREDIRRIYDRLGIEFDHELGESFYHDQLEGVVESLAEKGLSRESEGATCVFMEQYDTPMIIRKKDGAFLYATTDLATIQHRATTWQPSAMLYVVDHRQHQHFEKLFDAAKLWGYDDVEMTHVSFGTVLGDDGKPFKTRSGDTVGLEGLLDEAVHRAGQLATELNPEGNAAELQEVAQVVGIGGLKYADLSQNRSSDYKFSYDKMLALKGNTATYLQYSFARVQGILRKGNIDIEAMRNDPVAFCFENDVERELGVSLIRFGETLDEVLIDYKLNLLANYLFELAQTFSGFFENCPVLKNEDEDLKQSRLQLCDLTARTIQTGLSLLGIDVVEKM
ncbi:MAG: arginine--tRNA ligase [Mariniblastus sp.]|nr:arginine--tRNA ligase [Mariniblastus sp.]